MKHRLLAILFCLPLCIKAQTKDSISVYFPLNNAELTEAARHTVDSILQHHIFTPGTKLALIGYCDYVGGDSYNDSLSRARAQHVRSYLLSNGFKQYDIRLCIGHGKVNRLPVNGNEGYAPDRRVVIALDKPTNKIAKLAKLKVNEIATIEGLYFVPGSHRLMDSSQKALDELYSILAKNHKINVRIEGHICCITFYGDKYLNGRPIPHPIDSELRIDATDLDDNSNSLSLNRAWAVYEYLTNKGIDPDRLSYIGMGETRAEAMTEETQRDQQHNRRVDIRITSK
jgi:outer membrane protein OmpA-like peptidoglycan-associated protein